MKWSKTKLIYGNNIIKILKITPPPLLDEIIDALHEAQIAGEVTDTQAAEVFVKNYLMSKN